MDVHYMMNADWNTSQSTDRQLEAIATDIRESQPLTSPQRDLFTIQSSYEKGSKFDQCFQYLQDILNYSKVRTVRGDGNCYYRAFLYSLCEECCSNQSTALSTTKASDTNTTSDRMNQILQIIRNSINLVESFGYERFTIEMFWEELIEFLQSLPKDFHDELNEENSLSDYATWYLRILTAMHLKSDPDRFLPYLEGSLFDTYSNTSSNNNMDDIISSFCRLEVEPMGKECGMVQVIALAEALGVRVKIEYVDGHDVIPTTHTVGPEDSKIILTLLYRPGHYDILYKETKE
jgi:ubiquitin thioesterase protein OTUB1